jgi:kinesin family member C2/C3
MKDTMDTNDCKSVLRMDSPFDTNDTKSLSRVDSPQVEYTTLIDLDKVSTFCEYSNKWMFLIWYK